MTQRRTVALVACLAVVASCIGGAQAGYATLPLALSSEPEYQAFGKACTLLGLNNDGWFKSGYLEAIIYVPNNAAMTTFLAGKTVEQWVAVDKAAALRTVLHHFVSSATLNNWRSAYNGQVHSTLLTLLNWRSRLTVGINGSKRTVSSELTKANVLGSAMTKVGKHSRASIVPIDAVLLHDKTLPDMPSPLKSMATIYDVITKLPGLEDLNAMLTRALTVNPGLKAQLSDPTLVATFFGPNASGMGFLVEVMSAHLGSPYRAEMAMADPALCDRIVRYMVVPKVHYNATELMNRNLLENKRYYATWVPRNNLKTEYFHGHDILSSTFPVRNRGKFVNYMPKSFATVMKTVPAGTYDLELNAKIIVHVFDSFLVPGNL